MSQFRDRLPQGPRLKTDSVTAAWLSSPISKTPVWGLFPAHPIPGFIVCGSVTVAPLQCDSHKVGTRWWCQIKEDPTVLIRFSFRDLHGWLRQVASVGRLACMHPLKQATPELWHRLIVLWLLSYNTSQGCNDSGTISAIQASIILYSDTGWQNHGTPTCCHHCMCTRYKFNKTNFSFHNYYYNYYCV